MKTPKSQHDSFVNLSKDNYQNQIFKSSSNNLKFSDRTDILELTVTVDVWMWQVYVYVWLA